MKLKEFILDFIVTIIRNVIIFPIDSFLDTLQAYFSDEKSNQYLSGNYGPVTKELTAYNLPVTYGKIPSDLVGEFVRNGPNPVMVPKGGYHWFDGDGMLHGVRLTKDGKVSYINRLTKTKVLLAETHAGNRLKLRLGEMYGKIGLLKLIFQSLKIKLGLLPGDLGNTANTALVFHNNKLQALLEADVPYEIRMLYDGSFETAARLDYNGKLRNMSAHPKVDPVTKDLFYFGYYLMVQPWIIYGHISPSGELVRTMEIPLPEPIMMHDMAITEKHAIFLDTSLAFRKKNILTGKVFTFDKKHVSRIGIMDRYAKNADGLQWFEIPSCQVFHTINAWIESDDHVVVASCRASEFDLYKALDTQFEVVLWKCNLKTGKATEESVCPGHFGEFPQVHPRTLGRKSKYVYVATKPNTPVEELTGVLKMDLDTKTILGSYTYGDNKTAGEAHFVPKENGEAEDDGYLLTFVYDSKLDKSSFVVIDAKDLKLLASVDLPQRVPYGFHGLFVSEEEICSQLGF